MIKCLLAALRRAERTENCFFFLVFGRIHNGDCKTNILQCILPTQSISSIKCVLRKLNKEVTLAPAPPLGPSGPRGPTGP